VIAGLRTADAGGTRMVWCSVAVLQCDRKLAHADRGGECGTTRTLVRKTISLDLSILMFSKISHSAGNSCAGASVPEKFSGYLL
jgi:hypothetical protein